MTKNKVIRICLIGSEAAGKTCFLGGLIIAAERHRRSLFHSITGRDAPTKQYLQDLATTLRHQQWPAASTQLRTLDMDVRFNRHHMRLQMLDCSGEYLRGVINTGRYVEDDQLKQFLESSDFLLLVLDPGIDLQDPASMSGPDKDRLQQRLNTLVDIVAEVQRIQEEVGTKKVSLPQIAIVITKVDLYDNVDTPQKAEEYFDRNFQDLRTRLATWTGEAKFFPISAVGGTESSQTESETCVPAKDLDPKGYDTLMLWLLGKQRAKRLRPVLKTIFAFVIVAFIGGIGYYAWQEHMIEVIRRPTTSITDLKNISYKTGAIQRAIDAHLREYMSDLKNRLEALKNSEAQSYQQAKDLYEGSQNLKAELGNTSLGPELDALEKDCEENFESAFYKAVTLPGSDNIDIKGQALEYLKQFPQGLHADEVRKVLDGITQKGEEQTRVAVSRISPNEPGFFANKAKVMQSYLDLYPNNKDTDKIKKAIELSRQLSTKTQYTIEIAGWGRFRDGNPYKTDVQLFIGNSSEPVCVLPSSGKTTASTEHHKVQLPWKVGDAVRVELHAKGWSGPSVAAQSKSKDSVGLALFHGKMELIPEPAWKDYFNGTPYITCDVLDLKAQGDMPDPWTIFADWIYPGKKWEKTDQ